MRVLLILVVSGAMEAEAVAAYTGSSKAGTVPVYRFWASQIKSHFWTIKESEKNKLNNQTPKVWAYEGIVFYAYPPGQQPTGAKPVYRFWISSTRAHFYTMKESERAKMAAKTGVKYEGIAWYAYE
jgi:hypothetical protein